MDFSPCEELKSLRLGVALTSARSRSIWDEVVSRIIAPLGSRSRTSPIENLEIVFTLYGSLWSREDFALWPDLHGFERFRAGVRSLCRACMRVKAAGTVQSVSFRVVELAGPVDLHHLCYERQLRERYSAILYAAIEEVMPGGR